MNPTESKYVKQRKKSLRELAKLVYERLILNRQIRKLQKSMNEWDIALMGKNE